MSTRPYVTTLLEGVLLTAFQMFSAKRGCQTSGEGIRAMIRETQEYKDLTNKPKETSPDSDSKERSETQPVLVQREMDKHLSQLTLNLAFGKRFFKA
jgi:hypothetical protein